MRTIQLTLVTWLAAAGALASASDPPLRTDINPALLYYQAFLLAPDPLPNSDYDYLGSKTGRSQKLPARFGPLVAAYDHQFRLARWAAHSTTACNWGIDSSEGPATLLPHLARAKAIAQASWMRVRWHLEQERPAEACDDLLATFALGRNVARDGTLIGTLVQIAIEAIGCSTVAQHFGKFSPESLQALADGLQAGPARTTAAACLPTEKAIFHDGTVRKIRELQQAHPGDEAAVMAGVRTLLAGDAAEGADRWDRLIRAAGGTSEGVLKGLQEREQLYPKLAGTLTLPYADFVAAMAQLHRELDPSANPMLSDALASMEKVRAREFRILASLGMVRAAVEYKLRGEAGLRSITDPCGTGPFAFRRFVFEGVDRGFELRSVYDLDKNKAVLIFVETEGPAFRVEGPRVGEAFTDTPAAK